MTNNVSVGSLGKYPVLRDSAHIYPLSALHGPVSLPRNPYSPSLDTAPATTHKTETLNVATRRVEPCLSCIYYSSLVPEFRAVKILNINNQQVKEKVGRRTVEWSPLSPLPSRIGWMITSSKGQRFLSLIKQWSILYPCHLILGTASSSTLSLWAISKYLILIETSIGTLSLGSQRCGKAENKVDEYAFRRPLVMIYLRTHVRRTPFRVCCQSSWLSSNYVSLNRTE